MKTDLVFLIARHDTGRKQKHKPCLSARRGAFDCLTAAVRREPAAATYAGRFPACEIYRSSTGGSGTGLWPALPGIPAGLTATVGDAAATLNWCAAPNATGYNVKRAATSGGPCTQIATNLTRLACTKTGLGNGTLQYCVVSGTNFFGARANSSEVSVRPVSTAPVRINSTAAGNLLQLSWPADHLGWRLEAQTNSLAAGLGMNWAAVSGSSATNQILLPVNAVNGSVFLRLVYP